MVLSAGVLLSMVACNQILGNESATFEPEPRDADVIVRDGEVIVRDGEVIVQEAGSCPATTKACAGVCVSITDPSFGCNAETCEPCPALAFASRTCTDAGTCSEPICDDDHENCDRDPSNGCEADLTQASSCGDCAPCEDGQACLQDEEGFYYCDLGCTGPLVDCGDVYCVDTRTDPFYCGDCENEGCADNGEEYQACVNGACVPGCTYGFAFCGAGCEVQTNMRCGPTCADCTAMIGQKHVSSVRCNTGCEVDACAAGWKDDDATFENGCESPTAVP